MATDNLHFRNAVPGDADQLQQLVQSAFRADDSRQDWIGNLELAKHFRVDVEEITAKIANPDTITLMALDNNDALVASIEVSKRVADCGRLSMIAVDERYQRGGVGRRVLAYAEDYCRQTWGVKKLSLNALSTRKALIEWYIRHGYRKTGETTPFPREKFSNLVIPDDWHFVELEKELQ